MPTIPRRGPLRECLHAIARRVGSSPHTPGPDVHAVGFERRRYLDTGEVLLRGSSRCSPSIRVTWLRLSICSSPSMAGTHARCGAVQRHRPGTITSTRATYRGDPASGGRAAEVRQAGGPSVCERPARRGKHGARRRSRPKRRYSPRGQSALALGGCARLAARAFAVAIGQKWCTTGASARRSPRRIATAVLIGTSVRASACRCCSSPNWRNGSGADALRRKPTRRNAAMERCRCATSSSLPNRPTADDRAHQRASTAASAE